MALPLWVVGATRMRAVDDAWPAPGSKLHHSVGVWPLVLNDDTEVVDSVPGHRLDLRAKGWPMGEASVTITLEPEAVHTRVVIVEDAVEGPGTLDAQAGPGADDRVAQRREPAPAGLPGRGAGGTLTNGTGPSTFDAVVVGASPTGVPGPLGSGGTGRSRSTVSTRGCKCADEPKLVG